VRIRSVLESSNIWGLIVGRENITMTIGEENNVTPEYIIHLLDSVRKARDTDAIYDFLTWNKV
jgi:hypothetical protein